MLETYDTELFKNNLTLFYGRWFEGVRSPGTRVIDSCEQPCGSWEMNMGPLQEQPVILTLLNLSLQPKTKVFKFQIIMANI